MSLKDFFKNGSIFDSEKIVDVENSDELVQEYSKNVNRYIPEVDYSDPANFVRFGLAEEYYKDSTTRILEYYPYDGSLKDKLEWENNSLDLDLYIYKNLWPKTTGYANFSPNGWGADSSPFSTNGFRYPTTKEYVYFKTGPNVDNIYDANTFSNVCIDRTEGNTIEFWLKKTGFPATNNTCKYIVESIVDLYAISSSVNNRTNISIATGTLTSGITTSTGYGALSYRYNDSFSGSINNIFILDDNWHHYSFVFTNNSPNILLKVYRDGEYLSYGSYSSTRDAVKYPIIGAIGALSAPYVGASPENVGTTLGS